MNPVKWIDFFGHENVLIKGSNDDVFLVNPNERDEEGNSFTRILSKKALIEFVKKLAEDSDE